MRQLVAIFLAAAALTACGSSSKEQTQVKSVEDVIAMTRESNGSFRVTCSDGSVEYRSADDVRANRVCTRGGGGGSDTILRCVARDNDGRDPWVLAQFSANGSLTRTGFIYGTIAQCQDVLQSVVTIGWDTKVFCASRDRDGRDPWALGVIAGSASRLATEAVYGTLSQCTDSLRSSRRTRDFMLACASRDRDGRDPWTIVSVSSDGSVNLRADVTYSTFASCAGNL